MTSDPAFYLVAGLAVLVLGLAKGGFTGIGQLATPLVALVVPPLQAAAILLPILLVQDFISVWVYRRTWSRWNIKVMLPGAVVGIGIGWAMAKHLNDDYVRLALGIVAFLFVLVYWFGISRRLAPAPSATSGMVAGVLAGFTSTIAHAGSPPFQMHVFPQKLDKLTFAGTSAVFFAAMNYIKIIPFFALGQLTIENLRISMTLLPLAIATNLLGIWLVRVVPTQWFYRIVYVLMFAVSLELIREGALGVVAAR